MVGGDDGGPPCDGTGLFVATHSFDSLALHEPLHTMQAAALAGFPEVPKDTTSAIDTMAGGMGMANELPQPGIVGPIGHRASGIGHRALQPCIKTCTCHLQNPAHQGQRIFVTVLVHEAVLHSGSLEKYRAAFLRRSRSSSIRRIWARSRRSSLLASSSSLDCYSDLSGAPALTHL